MTPDIAALIHGADEAGADFAEMCHKLGFDALRNILDAAIERFHAARDGGTLVDNVLAAAATAALAKAVVDTISAAQESEASK